MSNLSDLLPAGASGKTIEAVATANITSKAPVILNSAGTVTQVAETTTSADIPLGSETALSSENTEMSQIHADPHNSNRWMVVYQDNAGNKYVRLRVITLSGTTFTLSGLSNVYTANSTDRYSNFAWDNTTPGNFLVIFRTISAATLSGRAGTVSGSAGSESFSYGTTTTIVGSSSMAGWPTPMQLQCLGTTGNYFMMYSPSNGYPSGIIVSVSGTTITVGGTTTVLQSDNREHIQCIVNPTDSDKVIAGYIGSSASWVNDVSISGTTISAGTSTSVGGGGSSIGFASIDGTRTAVVFGHSADDYLDGLVATLSGGTWSFGTKVDITAFAVRPYSTPASSAANPTMNLLGDANVFVCVYRKSGSDDYPYAFVGTVDGTTLTVSAPTALVSLATADYNNAVAQQSDAAGSFIALHGQTATTYLYARLGETGGTTSNLTATNFVGIADAAISSSATGTVVVQGGTVTGMSSLTTGSKYYVQDDGTVTTVSSSVNAGLAISTTSLLLNGDS